MTFTPKDWHDRSDTSTPLSAAALEDMETRLAAYADTVAAARQLLSAKDQASGYAGLDSGTKVPAAELGTGTPDATKFLRGDRSWQPVESTVVAQGPFTATTAATALAPYPIGTTLYETSGAPAADGSNIVNEWVKASV